MYWLYMAVNSRALKRDQVRNISWFQRAGSLYLWKYLLLTGGQFYFSMLIQQTAYSITQHANNDSYLHTHMFN